MHILMKWLRDLSLKYKLTLLLVVLTGTMLVAYGLTVLREFERDKIAYVLDSSLAYSRSAALQIRAEVNYLSDRVKFLMSGFDLHKNGFNRLSESNYQKENQFEAVLVLSRKELGDHFQIESFLKSNSVETDEFEKIKVASKILSSSVFENEIAVSQLPGKSKWLLGLRFGKDEESLAVISSLNFSHFLGFFESAQMQDTYLVSQTGSLVMSPSVKTYNLSSDEILESIQAVVKKMKSPEGVFRQQTSKGEKLLVSMASVGLGHLVVVSIVSESAALDSVKAIILKSVIFLAFLFCVTVCLSVLASLSLTSSLKRLLSATHEIGNGNFAVSVDIAGNDEVGALSIGFNSMAKEIERLMIETAEKVRMEGELKTAQIVQATLFPKDHLVERGLEIRGFYKPANECSGDWWYYTRMGHRTLICIGDATGHGVVAALITSAARSAASVIERFPDISLGEMMSLFNQAIYDTANGLVMMTFFLGIYDHQTGLLTYSRASHDPPFLLPNKEGLTKNDIRSLNHVNGPRLGQSRDGRYETAEIVLEVDDRIVLFTDGVTELTNETGKKWGERPFIKCLVDCSNKKMSLMETVGHIESELMSFRGDSVLTDDITYFIVSRSKVS